MPPRWAGNRCSSCGAFSLQTGPVRPVRRWVRVTGHDRAASSRQPWARARRSQNEAYVPPAVTRSSWVCDALTLASRQLPRAARQYTGLQSHQAEQPYGFGFRLPGRQAPHTREGPQKRGAYGSPRVERAPRVLRDELYGGAASPPGAVLPPFDAAPRGPVQSRETTGERALPGARGAHHGGAAAGRGGEGDVVQDGYAPVRGVQPPCGQLSGDDRGDVPRGPPAGARSPARRWHGLRSLRHTGRGDPASLQPDHVVRHGRDPHRVVTDQQRGTAPVRQDFGEQPPHPGRQNRVQAAGGLVQDQQAGGPPTRRRGRRVESVPPRADAAAAAGNDEPGSWPRNDTTRPRRRRAPARPNGSSPTTRTVPPRTSRPGRTCPSRLYARLLLPDPDRPTIPSTCPRSTDSSASHTTGGPPAAGPSVSPPTRASGPVPDGPPGTWPPVPGGRPGTWPAMRSPAPPCPPAVRPADRRRRTAARAAGRERGTAWRPASPRGRSRSPCAPSRAPPRPVRARGSPRWR